MASLITGTASSCRMETESTAKRIEVVVTILPQVEFVESIGGDNIAVTVMVPPGASPHTYEPTPSQMAALSRAKMYAKVGSGIDFELVWMDKLVDANKNMTVIDCSQGIELQEPVGDGEHKHQALDPHIWMSPHNTSIMVQNIARGLILVDPDGRNYYEQNRDAYLDQLSQLDRDIRAALSAVSMKAFMVYHPSLGYFARDYSLIILPIEEEGKEPTPASLAYLIEQAKELNITTIFASPQFNPQSAQVIANEIHGEVLFIDPLAREYIANLRTLLSELVKVTE